MGLINTNKLWNQKKIKMIFLEDLKRYHKFERSKSMEGIERLEMEVAELDIYSITKIFNYLKTRNDLYENFKNKEKSMEEMYDYIYRKSEKHKYKNMAMMDDKIVYMWAVTYFSKSNEELGIKKEKIAPSPTKKVEKKIVKEAVKEERAKTQDNQITLFQGVQK